MVPGEEILPAMTVFDAEHLLRLSIAAAMLLRASAEQHIDRINEHRSERLQDMKGGDE